MASVNGTASLPLPFQPVLPTDKIYNYLQCSNVTCWIFFFKIDLFLCYVCECFTCMSGHWGHTRGLWRPEDSTESPVPRVADGCNHVGLGTQPRSSDDRLSLGRADFFFSWFNKSVALGWRGKENSIFAPIWGHSAMLKQAGFHSF